MKYFIPTSVPKTAITKVIEALQPATTRMVGGVVRDIIINRPTTDVDLATTATPEVVTERLEAVGIKVVPTGIDHGTVTAVVDDVPLEITTLRKDIKTDGRRAVVEYTENFEEDSNRRDFTFNALYMDMDGKVYDFHNGVRDLKNGVVEFIGDPAQRITEDRLRILRYFRFLAGYASNRPSPQLLEILKGHSAYLPKLSAERITHELLRLLTQSKPHMAWEIMEHHQILAPLNLGESRVGALTSLVTMYPDFVKPVSRLISLYAHHSAGYLTDNGNLALSNNHKAFIKNVFGALQEAQNLGTPNFTPKVIAYQRGKEVFLASLRIYAATQGDEPLKASSIMGVIRDLEHFTVPTFPLTGQDVMALDVTGPRIGQALRDMEKWWLENGFPDRDTCLAELEKRF